MKSETISHRAESAVKAITVAVVVKVQSTDIVFVLTNTRNELSDHSTPRKTMAA